ncbi:MAG TPA: hypothetical protein VJ801_08055 [Polyangia bacterium]|jgi:FG-GAP repeat.|nr:hypothetical protein [Polyangia bacterium]
MNKGTTKLLASPILIVSLCAGCSLSGDTALDSPATVTQASSPANVVVRNQTTDFGDSSGVFGRGERAIMPGDLDGDGYGDMVVLEGMCVHILYGAGSLPHVLDTAKTATLVGSSAMNESCLTGYSVEPNGPPVPVQAYQLDLVAAGDVDRDGFADFLVFFDGRNDWYPDLATKHVLGTYLVYGGPTRLTGRHLLAESSAAFFASAYAPTGLGDVNGDGFADIGALDAGLGLPGPAGTVAVFFGSATRFTGEIALDRAEAHLSGPAGYLGLGLHPAGDLNGDGYADFVVGEFKNDPPWGCDQLVTRVWIVLGGTGVVGTFSLDTLPFIEGKIIWNNSGYAVPLGDLDGDGFDDLAVSTCHNPGQSGDTGSDTNILFGRPDLSTLQGPWDVTFPNTSSLVSADVDGDGIRDLIVGNPDANDGNGVVYIRRGTGARLSGSIDPTLGSLAIPSSYRGNGSCLSCGEAVGLWLIAGSDVDNDGVADILVGADVATDANSDPINDPVISAGHAYLLRGAAIKASLPQ